MALIDKLTAIADAIRGKTGKTEEMTLDQMVTEIEGIQTGGGSGGDDLLDTFLDGSFSGVYENANLTTLKGYAFFGLKNLTRISLPNVVNAGEFAFYGCSNLEEFDLSNLEVGSKQMFNACPKITSIVLPLLKEVPTQFSYSSSIVVADFPTASVVNSQSLSIGSLRTVILRHSAVASLRYTNAFNTTSVTNGTVKVYVPGSLVESYQTATNWSTLYAQNNNFIQPIEGSEYE